RVGGAMTIRPNGQPGSARRTLLRIGVILASVCLALATPLLAQQSRPRGDSLAPFVPTPQDVVQRMLSLAGVKAGDVVYDLGSGDGRLVIAAAKLGARGVGVDIDPQRIEESRANAKAAGVADQVEFRLQDALEADISDATVVTLYLLSASN